MKGERMPGRVEDLVGQQLAGYRLLDVLGRGGMSIVFLADRVDNPQERVAIKILMPAHGVTPDELNSFRIRFLREAETDHRLHHAHILPVLDYGEEDDILYMIMPIVTGGSLAELLAVRHEPLPLPQIAGYLNQLAGAIDYAHQHGFLHRDIKPSNVLLDQQGRVYLVDFGIVHLFDTGPYAIDQAPTTITTTGKIYGTPSYMAPERFQGEQVGPANDIYALGVLLYQLVTGQLPFRADSPIAIALKHINDAPPLPRSLRPDLPEPAQAVILRALAKDPAARFATASALAEAFDAGIKGQWAPGLLPLPPFQVASPDQDATLKQDVPLAPVVPLPEGPFESNQLILGPAQPPVNAGARFANDRPWVQPPPVPRERGGRRMLLLIVAILGVILLLLGLLFFGLQNFHLLPNTGNPTLPTTTPAVPATPVATPTSPAGATPTPTPRTTPTSGITPTPTPTPSPTPTPTPTPTTIPSPTLPPIPTPTPTP